MVIWGENFKKFFARVCGLIKLFPHYNNNNTAGDASYVNENILSNMKKLNRRREYLFVIIDEYTNHWHVIQISYVILTDFWEHSRQFS